MDTSMWRGSANLFSLDDVQLSRNVPLLRRILRCPKNIFLCFEGFRMLSSHTGLHLNFMNPCKGGKNTSCKRSISRNSFLALNTLVYIASVLAVEFALFNPLFYGSVKNKQVDSWVGPTERSCADLCWDENRASVIVPLTAFIAYFKKVISLYQHQAENCHVLVLGLVSF